MISHLCNKIWFKGRKNLFCLSLRGAWYLRMMKFSSLKSSPSSPDQSAKKSTRDSGEWFSSFRETSPTKKSPMISRSISSNSIGRVFSHFFKLIYLILIFLVFRIIMDRHDDNNKACWNLFWGILHNNIFFLIDLNKFS